MRFTWNEPIKEPNRLYPKGHWEKAVLGWLNYNGVWPEASQPRHWECEYNYCYHFFDLTVFECWLPGHGEPTMVIDAMRVYLEAAGLDYSEVATWTWDNGKCRPGIRFWIYAEDHPRKQRTPPKQWPA